MALTGRAAAAALLGALVVLGFRTWAALVAVNGLLLAAIVADLVLAASVRRLRRHPVRRHPGAAGRVRLGRGDRAQPRPPPAAGPAARRLAAERARGAGPGGAGRRGGRPGHGGQHAHPGPARRQGTPTVIVRSLGPLGLAARQGRHDVAWSVRVLPPFRSRRHLAEKLAQLRQLDGQHRSLLRGPGTEFDSLREYVIGDDVRSIDWRATARRGDVMVRTWRPERDRRILIVLDTGRTSAGRVGGIPRLDASMDAALLLTALAARAGDRVDLIAFDRRVRARVLGAPRSSVLASFTTAMAPLDAELIETDLAAHGQRGAHRGPAPLPGRAAHRPQPGGDRGGPAAPAGPLVSRNMVMIAAVADPRIAEMAAARGDAASVYDAAAAEGALAQRRRISALLRRQGVSVVDAPPDRLPSALADAYLDLKASGRL